MANFIQITWFLEHYKFVIVSYIHSLVVSFVKNLGWGFICRCIYTASRKKRQEKCFAAQLWLTELQLVLLKTCVHGYGIFENEWSSNTGLFKAFFNDGLCSLLRFDQKIDLQYYTLVAGRNTMYHFQYN